MPAQEKIVENMFISLPTDEKEVSEDFKSISPQTIYDIVQAHIIEEKPNDVNFRIKTPKDFPQDVLSELNKLKNDMGGSPFFGDKAPTINDEDSNRKFFGIPLSAVKDWLRMTLNKQWFPCWFWRGVASLFGVNEHSMSKYEDVHIRIQRFGLLIAHKKYFQEILDKKDTGRYSELSSLTGLAWHPTKNSPSVEKIYIDFIEKFLTVDFEMVKKQGKKALINYFKAFEGVCLEERARCLEEYAENNLTKNNVTRIADWCSNNTAEEVYFKEVQALALTIGEAPTASQLLRHLIMLGIFEMKFSIGEGVKSKPTFEGFAKWTEGKIEWSILREEKIESEPQVSINKDEYLDTRNAFKALGNQIKKLQTDITCPMMKKHLNNKLDMLHENIEKSVDFLNKAHNLSLVNSKINEFQQNALLLDTSIVEAPTHKFFNGVKSDIFVSNVNELCLKITDFLMDENFITKASYVRQ